MVEQRGRPNPVGVRQIAPLAPLLGVGPRVAAQVPELHVVPRTRPVLAHPVAHHGAEAGRFKPGGRGEGVSRQDGAVGPPVDSETLGIGDLAGDQGVHPRQEVAPVPAAHVEPVAVHVDVVVVAGAADVGGELGVAEAGVDLVLEGEGVEPGAAGSAGDVDDEGQIVLAAGVSRGQVE